MHAFFSLQKSREGGREREREREREWQGVSVVTPNLKHIFCPSVRGSEASPHCISVHPRKLALPPSPSWVPGRCSVDLGGFDCWGEGKPLSLVISQ